MKGMLPMVPMTLRDEALIPPANQLKPPPNRFTHRLREAAPFFYDAAAAAHGHSAGQWPARTELLLMADDGGPWVQVADAQGLYVLVARAALMRWRAVKA
jgi:hypothetical protein